MKKYFESNAGVTLIELMIVIAIVGIVSAITVGGYLSFKPGNVFRTAVSQLQNDLYRAKMRAVETRRQTRVVFSTNGYQIEDGSQVMNTPAGGWTTFRNINFSDLPEISLRNIDGTAIVAGSEPRVSFLPRGTAGTGSVRIFHPDAGTADIAVSIAGRVATTWN